MNRTIFGLVASCSVVAIALISGCKKEEPPPPLPAPQVVTAAPAPLQLKPEDAGMPKAPPAESAKPVTGGGSGSGGGLGPCCAALAQNAASMPDPTQKMYMTMAAQACNAFLAQGMGKAAAGQLSGMMHGAGLPAVCH